MHFKTCFVHYTRPQRTRDKGEKINRKETKEKARRSEEAKQVKQSKVRDSDGDGKIKENSRYD